MSEPVMAKDIQPRVVTIPLFRAVLIIVAFFAVAAVLSGIGSYVAIQKGNSNATQLEQRRAIRDKQQAVTNERLQQQADKLALQEEEIQALTGEIQSSFGRAQQVVCLAFAGSLEDQIQKGRTPDVPTIQFLAEFGCSLPPDLKALLPK